MTARPTPTALASRPNGRPLDLRRYALLEHMQVYDEPVSRVTGVGVHLPDRIVDNDEVASGVEAPPEVRRRLAAYIARTTGVRTRRYADPTDAPSDLAASAARRAMAQAGASPASIDVLIFASTDRDLLEPATANILQEKLGLSGCNAFDVSNACNSMLQGMNVANALLAAGAARRVLVACGELGSQWACRRVDSLEDLQWKMGGLTLGDAGAALLMEAADGASGITEINLVGLGEHWRLCHMPENEHWRREPVPSIHGWFYLDMPGLARLVRSVTATYAGGYAAYRGERFDEAQIMDHLDALVPHQISSTLIREMADSVLAGHDRIAITADTLGNTGSAAIPVTLHREIEAGRLALGRGQDVLLFGAASGLGMGHVRLRL